MAKWGYSKRRHAGAWVCATPRQLDCFAALALTAFPARNIDRSLSLARRFALWNRQVILTCVDSSDFDDNAFDDAAKKRLAVGADSDWCFRSFSGGYLSPVGHFDISLGFHLVFAFLFGFLSTNWFLDQKFFLG
jgi:hypothetical protein